MIFPIHTVCSRLEHKSKLKINYFEPHWKVFLHILSNLLLIKLWNGQSTFLKIVNISNLKHRFSSSRKSDISSVWMNPFKVSWKLSWLHCNKNASKQELVEATRLGSEIAVEKSFGNLTSVTVFVNYCWCASLAHSIIWFNKYTRNALEWNVMISGAARAFEL